MSQPTIADAEVARLVQSEDPSIRMLACEVARLRAAIREHMGKKGHELCWLNDVALWRTVSEASGYPHESLPVREEFLRQCAVYYESRVRGTPYEEPAAEKTVTTDPSGG